MLEAGSPSMPVGAVYDNSPELYAVLDDGETKTGKGAAGEAIYEALVEAGYNVYHDVAGDFYRRYVALVRNELGLGEDDALPQGDVLERAAYSVYESQRAYEKDDSLGDLQRDSISNSVSTLAKLAISQQAGSEWLAISVERARKQGAEVIVLDGRNLRDQIADQDESVRANIIIALDLYLTCDPETAARRTLLRRGISEPSGEQVAREKVIVEARRQEDRMRDVRPFIMPSVTEQFVPGQTRIDDVLQRTWEPHGEAELPASVVLDNSNLTKPEMLRAVSELAKAAVRIKVEIVSAQR